MVRYTFTIESEDNINNQILVIDSTNLVTAVLELLELVAEETTYKLMRELTIKQIWLALGIDFP